jgi:KUP system potassium uptake protein
MTANNPSPPASADEKSHDVQSTSGHQASGPFLGLAVGSVGVVYGDIGTSPLYAVRESLHHAAGDGVTRGEVIGVISLMLWALILVVTIKYVLLIMRADNQGEGGTLSLMALTQKVMGRVLPSSTATP